MLVLSRKNGESVLVDGPCKVTVIDIRGDKVRLGFTADNGVAVHREEVWVDIQARGERHDRLPKP